MKPRVFCAMPTHGIGNMNSLHSRIIATAGDVQIVTSCLSQHSIITRNFNKVLAIGLTLKRNNQADYLLMQHDDIEVRTMRWIDLLVSESQSVGAALLSVVMPIKDNSKETSTAIESDDPWNPRKLTLYECWNQPPTFNAFNGSPILVNTGLLLFDLSRTEWLFKNLDGELVFHFHIDDRIIERDGEFVPECKPEDWNFSRLCHAHGLPVYATTKIEAVHHGAAEFSNRCPDHPAHYYQEIQGWYDDFKAVYREAVRRVPDGGTIVEVGCWKGRSLSYLLVEAKLSGKELKIIGVDEFKGSIGQPDMQREAATRNLFGECDRNCERAQYPFKLFQRSSVEEANRRIGNSIDFVFLDASHDYDSVIADIRAWLPKVKRGGVLAGDDFYQTDIGVVRAVRELLPTARVMGRCWWYEKE